MRQKSIRNMSVRERKRHSLTRRTIQATLKLSAILGLVSLLIGLSIFTYSLVNQYIMEASSLSRSAVDVLEQFIDVKPLAEEVMAVYSSQNEGERQQTGTEDYFERFSHIIERADYKDACNTLRVFANSYHLDAIYMAMFDVKNSAMIYIVDPEESDPLMPGEWESVSRDGIDKFLNWAPDKRIYEIANTAEYGWLCTSGVPIYDSEGDILAFVFVDISLADVQRGMRLFVIGYVIALSLATVLIGISSSRRIQKTLAEPITTIAEAAQSYVMGMRYSKTLSPKLYAYRGFELLTIAQLVNIIRDSIPSMIAYWITGEQIYIANVLVVQTDILTFAGFAFLLMGFIVNLNATPRIILAIGIIMNATAFALSGVFRTTGNYAVDQFLGFFVVTNAEAYFPLFCYFIFVAFGYAMGGIYRHIADKDGLSTRVLQICLPVVILYNAVRFFVPIPLLPQFNTLEQYILNPLSDAWINCIMAMCWMALFHKLLKLRGGKAPFIAMHFSLYVNSYYCISYAFFTPLSTLLQVTQGSLMTGTWMPFLYGMLVFIACYFIIDWNEKNLHFSISKLRGRRRAVVFAVIWIMTIAIGIYAYPRIDVFATVWNDYLW